MTRGLAVLGAGLVLAMAGCGDDDSGDDAPAGAGAGAERTTTSEVEVVRAVPGGDEFDAAAIYERDAPSVVTITSVFGSGLGARGGQGSGFVVSRSGEIATNAHVITDGEGEDLSPAEQVFVQFADGNQVDAEIVGFDPNSDVGLLKIDPEDFDLRALPFADTDRVVVGEPVIAIGSPFGEESSLSVGVVSATNRSIDSLTGFSISGAIQTDAAINRGNSGGPLLDARGRVLGINSQIRSSSGTNSGVGFAVAGDTVQRSLEQLRSEGEVDYAYLGVSSSDVYPQLSERFDLGTERGAWVQEVVDDGPADEAGLRAGSREVRFQAAPYRPGGDVIVGVEGRTVSDADDLGQALLDFRPGQTVTLQIVRGGERQEVDVRVEERPADTGP
jgi:S1-C subfamily serine protease